MIQTTAETYLNYLFAKLEQFRLKQISSPIIKLTDEVAARVTVSAIIELLSRHFAINYKGFSGAARLPVLALYSAYQCLMEEVNRYQGKKLQPLESHTAADSKSGSVGDIEIVQLLESDKKLTPFEGVEVKFRIPISLNLVQIAYQKIRFTKIERYYLLSTIDVREDERIAIAEFVALVKAAHGCEIIVNGVIPSLKYYLRLLNNTVQFLEYYAENLEKDGAIKSEHRQSWSQMLQNY